MTRACFLLLLALLLLSAPSCGPTKSPDMAIAEVESLLNIEFPEDAQVVGVHTFWERTSLAVELAEVEAIALIEHSSLPDKSLHPFAATNNRRDGFAEVDAEWWEPGEVQHAARVVKRQYVRRADGMLRVVVFAIEELGDGNCIVYVQWWSA